MLGCEHDPCAGLLPRESTICACPAAIRWPSAVSGFPGAEQELARGLVQQAGGFSGAGQRGPLSARPVRLSKRAVWLLRLCVCAARGVLACRAMCKEWLALGEDYSGTPWWGDVLRCAKQTLATAGTEAADACLHVCSSTSVRPSGGRQQVHTTLLAALVACSACAYVR